MEMKRENWVTIAVEGGKVITGISRSNFTVNLRHSRKVLKGIFGTSGSMALVDVFKVCSERSSFCKKFGYFYVKFFNQI